MSEVLPRATSAYCAAMVASFGQRRTRRFAVCTSVVRRSRPEVKTSITAIPASTSAGIAAISDSSSIEVITQVTPEPAISWMTVVRSSPGSCMT